MFNNIVNKVKEYLRKNYNIVLSVSLVFVVAVVVCVALGASGQRKIKDIMPEKDVTAPSGEGVEEIPLTENNDDAIRELVYTYYNAQATGDIETIKSVCDEVSDLDILSFEEKANYIDLFPKIEIYTKQGMNEGEWVVYVYYRMTFTNHEEEFPGYTSHYVCTAADGSLYIKRSNFSDELNEYTSLICAQDDVVEFNNRVSTEYDTFKEEHPDLAGYPEEIMAQVNMTVGVKWSELQAAAEAGANTGDNGENPDATVSNGDLAGENEPLYAFATTTVNVRSSDSEQADKLGKATGGMKLEVLEQRVNGWSKVVYEGKEGFIKTEFLQTQESASKLKAIGKITANTNINVRADSNETAAKLGVLTGGDTADLVENVGEWCKIKYNGQVGYVKAEYVTTSN